MKLILVRHGEPLKNDYGIADKGKMELKLLAEFLEKNFKVNQIYSGNSQRAIQSADILNTVLKKNIEFYDWLSEFKYRLPNIYTNCEFPWEFPPQYWVNHDSMLDYKLVLENNCFKYSNISKNAKNVWNKIDCLIAKNGYEREGNLYKVIRANRNEILIVTHFATMAIILAHLLNISILISLNMLFMAPSSYTVMSTEEIIEGQAIFRCLELGSTKHLYGHDDLLSEYGRQIEIYKEIK